MAALSNFETTHKKTVYSDRKVDQQNITTKQSPKQNSNSMEKRAAAARR